MSEPTSKPARPVSRWGIGTLSVLQTVLLALILGAVNYLALHHFTRKDLSRDADYTLSPATKNYLASDAVGKREKPVKWILMFRRTSPFYERTRALVEEYERLADGGIELEVVDPIRSPDRVQELNATYGLTLVKDPLIIDARSDDSPAVSEDANKVRSFHPHVKLVFAEELGVFSTADGIRRVTAYQGEDVITARFVEAIEGKPRVMALLADKSRLDSGTAEESRRSLEDLLRYQNVQLAELRLADAGEVPEEVSGLVIAAPKYDLSDQEMEALEAYWTRPKAAILVFLDGGEVPPKLRAFLRGNGVTPRDDRVITRIDGKLVTNARGVFTRGIPFLSDLAGQTGEFRGATSSLEVREGAEDLLNRKVFPMGLFRIADGFWGETEFGKGKEAFDETKDNGPPIFGAACVIRGAESNDRFASESARMAVVSNLDILHPDFQQPQNLDFLASTVNWLVGRESLAGIGARSLGTFKMPVLDAQVSFINRVNLIFLPAGLLLIGAFVWSSRRV
ncbi:MAG: Gldg family protein [Akkermansiaceae bacterium]|nr:Gldg family protein [Akkermansiaceae bacterium]MCP5546803.1 Gldg family protein [Akkermansiaceae bacterium]